MKILLIPSSYFPILGGLQEAVYQLAREFKRQGHDVFILTNRYPRHLRKNEVIDGINVERMLFTGFYLPSFNPYVVLKYVAGFFISVINFFRLTVLLKRTKPDVLNIHFLGSQAPYAILASKLLKIRCVVSLHGDDVEGLPHRSGIDHWLFKKVLLSADYVTACSNYLLDEAKKIVPEIKEKSIAIWNGINPEEYRDIRPYKHPRPYIFAGGRFVYAKGFDVLLHAYRRLLDAGQKIDLILAGDGPERENLINLRRELQLPFELRELQGEYARDQASSAHSIIFWGRANKNEMKSLMKGCAIVVVPSRKESFGMVALEAFASRKKVVAAHTGGLAEIIQDGTNGYFVKAGNAEDLARGIKKALSDNLKDIQMDLNKFSWKEVSLKYLKIYILF